MANIAKSGQVGQQFTLKSVVRLVVDVQILPRATSLTLLSVRMPITLTYKLPSRRLDVGFIILAELEHCSIIAETRLLLQSRVL